MNLFYSKRQLNTIVAYINLYNPTLEEEITEDDVLKAMREGVIHGIEDSYVYAGIMIRYSDCEGGLFAMLWVLPEYYSPTDNLDVRGFDITKELEQGMREFEIKVQQELEQFISDLTEEEDPRITHYSDKVH